MIRTYRVTGYVLTDTTRESVSREVRAASAEAAIAEVNCDALEMGKLLVSASATPYVRA